MQPEPQAGNSVELRKRPWYRLHLSTWLMLLPVAALLVVTIVPQQGLFEYDHGWPWTFARWTQCGDYLAAQIDPADPRWPFWMDSHTWSFADAKGVYGDLYEIDAWDLVLDAIAALAILAAIGFLCEWRRRKRYRFFQYTLRQALGVMFIVAVLGSLRQMLEQPSCAEQEAFDELKRSAYVKVENITNVGPPLLRRLLGDRIMGDGVRVTELRVDYDGVRVPVGYLDAVKAFSHLKGIWVGIEHMDENLNPTLAPGSLRSLRSLPKLTEVGVVEASLSDDNLSDLAAIGGLRGLSVLHAEIGDGAVETLGRMTSLKVLVMSGTKITAHGGERLKALLPGCRVLCVDGHFLRGTEDDLNHSDEWLKDASE